MIFLYYLGLLWNSSFIVELFRSGFCHLDHGLLDVLRFGSIITTEALTAYLFSKHKQIVTTHPLFLTLYINLIKSDKFKTIIKI